MAAAVLRRHRGDRLAYVGEPRGGSTATPEFFDELEQGWEEARHVAIPQWDGMQDALRIYRRRP